MNKTGNVKGRSYIVPFILITMCFALWGFANDITNPMVKAFSKIFRMSTTEGAMVQVAFYGGYFCMAVPAAMFIRRFSYKAGILMGLALYAVGGLLFFPAKMAGEYFPFLVAYFVMTCGLSFLETSANPYILSMGPENTATRRLNLAQAFNPIGSLLGMYVAMNFIQARMSPLDTEERSLLSDAEFEAVKQSDLAVLIAPYVLIAAVIAVLFVVIWLYRMPSGREYSDSGSAGGSAMDSVRRLWANKAYKEGVVAQFFYVGAQIMCWTFIIQYGTRLFVGEGMEEQAAEVLSQKFNIAAMLVFCVSRFVCTFLLRFFSPGRLLAVLASAGALLTCGTIMFTGMAGMYCLVGISACMSLMFPTIYGIALKGLGEDAKFGAAGLIMSILGGSLLPPLQARIIDMGEVMGHPAVNVSFVLPLVCFAVVMLYGVRTVRHNG